MFVLYCYVYADKNPTLITAYKSKKTAIENAKKKLKSGCYEKIQVIETKEKMEG